MYTNDELKNLSPEEKKRQINAINMQLTILDSDQRKLLAEKSALDVELKRLKIDQQRVEIALGEKKERLEKLAFEILQNEEEMSRMKKRLNLL